MTPHGNTTFYSSYHMAYNGTGLLIKSFLTNHTFPSQIFLSNFIILSSIWRCSTVEHTEHHTIPFSHNWLSIDSATRYPIFPVCIYSTIYTLSPSIPALHQQLFAISLNSPRATDHSSISILHRSSPLWLWLSYVFLCLYLAPISIWYYLWYPSLRFILSPRRLLLLS